MKGHYTGCRDPAGCWCEVRRLVFVFGVTLAILTLQVVGGLVSGSLALLADAGHVFGDSTAIVVTLIAAILVRFGARTKRVRDAAFTINVGLLFFIVGWIVFEAYERFHEPREVWSAVMVPVAFLGGIGNYCQHRILEGSPREHKHHAHKALSIHVLSDLAQSGAVVVAGVVIWVSGWHFIDPLLSFALAAWILSWAVKLALNPHGSRHHN